MACQVLQRLNTASSLAGSYDSQMITITYQTGAQFEGKLLDYKRAGRGTFIWPNGSKYEGDYFENLRHGEGTQVWSDSSTYTGDFLNNLRHGQGRMCWSDGETYEGMFFKDRRHGKGTYTWPDGSSYSGTFYMDKKEGFGTFYFSNGDKFEGLYLKDEREGPGAATYRDGQQDVGLWSGEKLIKLCTEIKGAFTIRSHPEFEFKPEEQILYIDMEDENRSLAPVESILNPPLVLDYPPKPDLTQRLNELFSDALHPQSLAIDKQTFDREFFKDVPGYVKWPEKLVAWNATPYMLSFQKHFLKHWSGKTDTDVDMDAVVKLDRSRFGESGPLEQQSQQLIMSAEAGHDEEVEKLLNSGKVHPDVSDCHGHTPLIGATVNWHIDVINILLNNGANINQVNDEGCSALSAAAVFCYPMEGFIDNIAEGYIKPKPELMARVLNQHSQARDTLSDKNGRKISQLNQADRKKSEEDQISRKNSEVDQISRKNSEVDQISRKNSEADQISRKKSEEDQISRKNSEVDQISRKNSEVDQISRKNSKADQISRKNSEVDQISRKKSEEDQISRKNFEVDQISRKKSEEDQISWKNSEVDQISRKNSEVDQIESINSESTSASVIHIEEKIVSMLESELRPQRQMATEFSEDVRASCDALNHEDVGSAHSEDAEDEVQELGEEEDPEDFESSQSLRNYRIEVTDELIERCATQLIQNELVVGRKVSGASEMGKARLLAIHMCLHKKMKATLNLLLKRGSNPNTSSVPLPVLFMAIKSADIDIVRLLLLKGANTNARLSSEKGGLYPLHIACALPRDEGTHITELLLNALADPNARAEEDDSFLSHFLEEEWSKDVIPEEAQSLLGGRTALHIACARNDYKNACQVVRLLLQHKADTSLMCNGFTPLALAIASGNDLAVDELLMFGADPSLPLTHGVGSALCVAVNTQYEHRRTIHARLQLIDKLIMAGANVLAPISIGLKRIVGTAVDYAYYIFNQDRRIAHIPYHALTHAERETYNARRKLLAHVGDAMRVAAIVKEKRRNLEEEEEGMRSQSSSANFVYIGAGAKLPPGFKSRSASKGGQGQVKFQSSGKEVGIKLSKIESSSDRKPRFKYCYECGRSVGVRLTACTRCKEVYYCSKACKLTAWSARHKNECIRIGGHSRSPSPKNRTGSGTSAANRGNNVAASQVINVSDKSLRKSAERDRKAGSHKFRTGSPPNYEYVYIDNYSHN